MQGPEDEAGGHNKFTDNFDLQDELDLFLEFFVVKTKKSNKTQITLG